MWRDASADCRLVMRQTLECTCRVCTRLLCCPQVLQLQLWTLGFKAEDMVLGSSFPGRKDFDMSLFFLSILPLLLFRHSDFRLDMPILVEKFPHKLLFLWQTAMGVVCCVCDCGTQWKYPRCCILPHMNTQREPWVGGHWKKVSRPPVSSAP